MPSRTIIRWLAYLGVISIFVHLFLFFVAYSFSQMESGYGEYEDAERERLRASEARSPQWFPGGDSIAFSYQGRVFTIDSLGSCLHEVHVRDYGRPYDDLVDLAYAPSVSPDGTRIAYAAYKESGWLFWKSESWEIMTAMPDGSDKHQLTKDGKLDSYPFWSTDGTSIFFVSQRATSAFRGINVMSSGGSETRAVYPEGNSSVSGSPALSPDGSRIAFIVSSIKEMVDASSREYVHRVGSVYSIEVDGSGLTKLAEDAGSALWSPDGTHLAFTGRFPLNSPAADGIRSINLHADDPSETLKMITGESFDWTDSISWSPDGSEILFGPYVVKVDGSDMRRLPGPGSHTSWSPDGSRIATYVDGDSDVVLYTVARDGSDSRVLVEKAADGSLVPANGRPLSQP